MEKEKKEELFTYCCIMVFCGFLLLFNFNKCVT